MKRDNSTARADNLLCGAWYGSRYHYWDDGTDHWYSVTRGELQLLERILEADEKSESDSTWDGAAFSEWAACVPSRIVDHRHREGVRK